MAAPNNFPIFLPHQHQYPVNRPTGQLPENSSDIIPTTGPVLAPLQQQLVVPIDENDEHQDSNTSFDELHGCSDPKRFFCLLLVYPLLKAVVAGYLPWNKRLTPYPVTSPLPLENHTSFPNTDLFTKMSEFAYVWTIIFFIIMYITYDGLPSKTCSPTTYKIAISTIYKIAKGLFFFGCIFAHVCLLLPFIIHIWSDH